MSLKKDLINDFRRWKMLKARKGQSTLEYVIILTAVIAAIIVGVAVLANPADRGNTGLGKLFTSAGDRITDATARLPGVE